MDEPTSKPCSRPSSSPIVITPMSTWPATGANTTAPQWICPDLLSIRQIGAADGWRGRVVRAFFIALKKITGV